jgi:nucleotidyltransferase/DNA polymerase involved in DNA repair
MTVLYCAIPYFAAALARRDDPRLHDRPLVLLDPQDRVFGFSREAALAGVTTAMAARRAQIRCPDARLIEADVGRCRQEYESYLQLMERASSCVEPHGWGAYVDLWDQEREAAIAICRELGQAVRRELGDELQPALGWNSTKFVAQVASRRTRPGHLLAVSKAQEQPFLSPQPVSVLPLPADAVQRLYFLGLRTLGQYANLPSAAVLQQFGKAGQLAQRYARGQDDRPVIPRWRSPKLAASLDLEHCETVRARLVAALQQILSPLVSQLQATLRACGRLRLDIHFDDGHASASTRVFATPIAELRQLTDAAALLLDRVRWTASAVALHVALEEIQDAVVEQLMLFEVNRRQDAGLRQVQQYLVSRFGESPLKRAAVTHPGAPLPEWRVSWQSEES